MMRAISRRSYVKNRDRAVLYRNRPEVREKHVRHTADWRLRNPEQARMLWKRYSHRRRQVLRSYRGDVLTSEEWHEIVTGQGNMCVGCGCDFNETIAPTVDHVCTGFWVGAFLPRTQALLRGM